MTKKLTILFVPISAVGHINSSIGIGEILKSRGHRIIFAVDQSFKGMLIRRGFEEEIIEKELTEEERRDPSGYFINLVKRIGLLDDYDALDKLKIMVNSMMKPITKNEDEIIGKLISKIKPDLIVNDLMFAPAIINCGIPWISVSSVQILSVIDDPRTPPMWLGLSSIDNTKWKYYRELIKDDVSKLKKTYQHLFAEDGIENPFPYNRLIESPYLNVYPYPKELDYTDQRPLPPKWYQFDSFIRMEEFTHFEIPEKLAKNNRKIIFLSMGSLGSANIDLMKRLLDFVSELPFNFIVCKGKINLVTFNLVTFNLFKFNLVKFH